MSTKETFVKKSQKQICSLYLKDLESKNKKFEFINDKALIPANTFMDLVLFSPSEQSNLGEKLSSRIQKHIDELVKDLILGLDIKETYFFSAFTSKQEKDDLSNRIMNSSEPFIALYCPNCFTESLYSSIRNALAHGNIAKMGSCYFLYSVSSKFGNDIPDKDKPLSFLLKLYKLNKIESYIEVFKKYN